MERGEGAGSERGVARPLEGAMMIFKIAVATGIHFLEIPEAGLRILCGCPADAVKHLIKRD